MKKDTIKSMTRRLMEAGYTRTYVRSQVAEARRWIALGRTPDGTASDMCCDFWVHLAPSRVAKDAAA